MTAKSPRLLLSFFFSLLLPLCAAAEDGPITIRAGRRSSPRSHNPVTEPDAPRPPK